MRILTAAGTKSTLPQTPAMLKAASMIPRLAGILLILSLSSLPQTAAHFASPNAPISSADAITPISTDSPFSVASPPETPAPVVCPAGGPVGAINLMVHSSRNQALPLEKINNLSENDVVVYSPLIRGKEVRHGEVSLVLVPARRSDPDAIIVTDPKPADKPQEWKIDQTISLVAYIYGPAGLSKKKVKGFLSQDDLLIAQLADYAEKTTQTEALIAALSDSQSSSAGVNAALNGFASQYGVSVPIDKTAPTAVQAQTLFATMNPQLATYDPLTASGSSRISQTASLTAAAAGLFFGSPIGLAAGGTAMLLDLRSMAFPGTQFRSSFAQPLNPGLNLCGQRNPAPPHTRVAYIWANRIPNAPAPKLKIQTANFVPQGLKTPVPVNLSDRDWRYLDRARNWTLENGGSQKAEIKVLKLANQKSVELDLTKANLPPGDYHLRALWDWTPFESDGIIAVRPLSTFQSAKLEASSQDRLLARTGKLAVTLEQSDFEFVTKAQLQRLHDEFATPEPIPFLLPRGLRQGPQDHIDLQIDTTALDPGDYQVLLSQDDKSPAHSIPIQILPSPPEIVNLPIIVNQGSDAQHVLLKGKNLDIVAKLETPGVTFDLAAASAGASERKVTVHLSPDLKPGATLPVSEFLKDRNQPLTLADGVQVKGPLPIIIGSKVSPPLGSQVALNSSEFPAGGTISAMLMVKNAAPHSALQLTCDGDPAPVANIRIGEQTERSSLQMLSPDQLYLSFDTSPLPAGCSIQAVLNNGTDGLSQPYSLVHIVRLPVVEQLAVTGETAPDSKRVYLLTGRNLEMIQEIGWDQLSGATVDALPAAMSGQGQRQILRIALLDPPTPTATLYLWLRGDPTARSTTIPLTKQADVSPLLPK